MIGRLRGVLASKHPPSLLVDVNGVGYEVDAPMSTFYQLPEVGREVILHTHLVVREDAHQLYGFSSESERSMFRRLIRVNGVGAKMAITILSGISADAFARCVEDGDTRTLTRLPGVGKKTAERLIMEMRDRLKDMPLLPVSAGQVIEFGSVAPTDATSEAVSALVALGYRPQEASRMVSGIDTDGLQSEDIIRSALRAAAKA